MQCQKCGHEQDDGLPECRNCGVIFVKIMHDAAPPSQSAPAPEALQEEASGDASVSDNAKPAPLPFIIVALLVVAALYWWLNFPPARSIPEGAYVNSKNRFALVPPAEWLLLTPENHKKILAKYKDRFPKDLRDLISSPGFEVSFVRIPEEEEQVEFTPSFNVVTVPLKGNLPALTESEKENAAKIISAEMLKKLDTYELKSSAIVEVDGISSLQINGTAELNMVIKPSEPIMSEPGAFGMRHVEGHTEEVSKDFELKCVQTFVPGRGKGYVISCTDEAGAFPETEEIFNEVLDSFRLMDKPPRFGGILGGALNGGLIGAGLYLLWIVLARLSGSSKK